MRRQFGFFFLFFHRGIVPGSTSFLSSPARSNPAHTARATLLQMVIAMVLVLVLLTNVLAGLFFNARRPVVSSERTANGFQPLGGGGGGSSAGNRLRYDEPTKRISIEVLSSKDRVKISVDDATVTCKLFLVHRCV